MELTMMTSRLVVAEDFSSSDYYVSKAKVTLGILTFTEIEYLFLVDFHHAEKFMNTLNNMAQKV